jgi:hypothetical protein
VVFAFLASPYIKKMGLRVGKSCEREEDASREERERMVGKSCGVWAPHCHRSFFYVEVGGCLPHGGVHLSGLFIYWKMLR